MKNIINIKGNNQIFPYLIEYIKDAFNLGDHQIGYTVINNDICLFDDDVTYFRNKNEWYDTTSLLQQMTTTCVPNSVKMSTININIPY